MGSMMIWNVFWNIIRNDVWYALKTESFKYAGAYLVLVDFLIVVMLGEVLGSKVGVWSVCWIGSLEGEEFWGVVGESGQSFGVRLQVCGQSWWDGIWK